VQVLAADVEAARAILADIDRAREKRHRAEEMTCPQCGTVGAVRTLPPGRWIGLTLLAFAIATSWLNVSVCFPLAGVGIALLLWPMMPKWRCRACGHRWRAPAPSELPDEDCDDAPADRGGDQV
jgi:rubredoxin